MANLFVNGLKTEENKTYTTNGCQALKSTNNSLLDLFGSIGSLRSRTEDDITRMFSLAFAEDKLLATKMSFYCRDIRDGGQGERNTPKVIWKFLAKNYPEIIKKNIANIAYFGRFDDLYCLIGTPVEEDVWKFIYTQIIEDIKNMNANKPISLAAKWLKSCNASSKETIKLGKLTAKNLHLSPKDYRHVLSSLRAYINVTEVKMSANKWDKIDYEKVPSKAMNIYRNAFKSHDTEGFADYIGAVVKGEAKINATTLFPYDIAEKYLGTSYMWGGNFRGYSSQIDPVLEEQWKALPNYVDGENNVLVMADVSGSMRGRPMATSVGLATYFAERNSGAFKNLFMSFSSRPQLVELKGESLYERITNVMKTHWDMNTNIESAFNMVLMTALKNNVPANQMPKAIVIISDMQFDSASGRDWTFYDKMKTKFNTAGYEIPNIVFWNVNDTQDTFHAFSDYHGVQMASGQSASTFKQILANFDSTPYESMLKTLNSEVYNRISI